MFWRDSFGISARRVGSFERPVRDLLTASHRGRIDFLWNGWMRDVLLGCCRMDRALVSPAILAMPLTPAAYCRPASSAAAKTAI